MGILGQHVRDKLMEQEGKDPKELREVAKG